MFESSPQSKCAVSYLLQKPLSGETVSVIVLYSVSTNMILRMMRCEAEVTQMCTPGDDGILIVGTILGSIYLYDLNEYESSSQRIEELDYEALVKAFYPDVTPENEDQFNERM
jgi:hypothetical protein